MSERLADGADKAICCAFGAISYVTQELNRALNHGLEIRTEFIAEERDGKLTGGRRIVIEIDSLKEGESPHYPPCGAI